MTGAANLIHEVLPVGMLQCNCHIVGDPVSREALVIDPGDEAGRILEILERHKLNVRAIVSTHAHIDHVGGLWRMHQVTGAPVHMHADDLDLYKMLDVQARWIGMKTPEKVEVDQVLHEGDSLRWGPFAAHVVHTPGHTRGSICLYLPAVAAAELASQDAPGGDPAPGTTLPGFAARSAAGPGRLFAGDTLFAGSIGRTDLWGGSFETLLRSLTGKLLELPDDTLVYPGHGESTTIGKERETNPFLTTN